MTMRQDRVLQQSTDPVSSRGMTEDLGGSAPAFSSSGQARTDRREDRVRDKDGISGMARRPGLGVNGGGTPPCQLSNGYPWVAVRHCWLKVEGPHRTG